MYQFILEVSGECDGPIAQKMVEYHCLPSVGDQVWFEIEPGVVTDVRHHFVSIEDIQPGTIVCVQIDSVKEVSDFRRFFTRTKGWEFLRD